MFTEQNFYTVYCFSSESDITGWLWLSKLCIQSKV